MASRLSTVLAFSLALADARQALAVPQPPLRAVWSWNSEDYSIRDDLIDGDVAYLLDRHALVALDLATGKERWRKVVPEVPEHRDWQSFSVRGFSATSSIRRMANGTPRRPPC